MSEHSSRGKGWDKVRLQVLAAHDYICVNCDAPATHVDHIVPKALGGTDELTNLQAMCATCNLKKGMKVQGDRRTWSNDHWFKGYSSTK